MNKTTRRDFLEKGSPAAAAVSVTTQHAAHCDPATAQRQTPLTQFDYRDVQLLDGPMLVQFQQNHSFFLNLNEDGMLKPFRQLAGQPAPGEDLGGWYSPSSASIRRRT